MNKGQVKFAINAACLLIGVLVCALPNLIGTKETVNSVMVNTYPVASVFVRIIGAGLIICGVIGMIRLSKTSS